jgi:hypothetical protein
MTRNSTTYKPLKNPLFRYRNCKGTLRVVEWKRSEEELKRSEERNQMI